MNNNLYFVANSGCDATTYGLVRISGEDFPKFETFIRNLNKNSHYGCMPVICVYKVTSMDVFRECDVDPDLDCWDDGYVDPDNIFYLDGKTYTFKEEFFSYYREFECVIEGDE